MSAQQVSTSVFTINSKSTGNAYRAIGINGAQVTAINSRVIGFSEYDYGINQNIKVNRGPTVMAEAGGILDGTIQLLKTDIAGRVITAIAGEQIIGYLKPGQIAQAPGVTVEIITLLT